MGDFGWLHSSRKVTRPVPVFDSKGTTGATAIGTSSFEQAGGLGIRNHGVYRADTPGAYHAKNGSRLFRNSRKFASKLNLESYEASSILRMVPEQRSGGSNGHAGPHDRGR